MMTGFARVPAGGKAATAATGRYRGCHNSVARPMTGCQQAATCCAPTAKLELRFASARASFAGTRHRRRPLPSAPAKDDTVATAWFALFLAGLLEIGWALGLKYSDGLTRFWPSVATMAAIAMSFGLIGVSLKSLPFGTVYAVWTGIGAAGTMLVGMVAFGEPAGALRVMCLALIVVGIVGLKLATPS
jgi:quaternary ammonium compound-resistance protein SugE